MESSFWCKIQNNFIHVPGVWCGIMLAFGVSWFLSSPFNPLNSTDIERNSWNYHYKIMKLVISLEFKKVLLKFTHRNPAKVNHTEWIEHIQIFFLWYKSNYFFYEFGILQDGRVDYHLLCNFSSWFSIMCTLWSLYPPTTLPKHRKRLLLSSAWD